VEQNCKNLGGRYYHVVQDDGSYYEQCCYPSLNPDVPEETCDQFVDGKYEATDGTFAPKAPPNADSQATGHRAAVKSQGSRAESRLRGVVFDLRAGCVSLDRLNALLGVGL
jgi:hypothetical protein